MNRPKKLLLFFFRLVFSMSGFANGLDNKTDLYGGEGTGGVGHAIALQGFLKLGLKTDPMHELAASGCLGNMGVVELGQLALSISTYLKLFHKIIGLTCNKFTKKQADMQAPERGKSCSIKPYRAATFRRLTEPCKQPRQGSIFAL